MDALAMDQMIRRALARTFGFNGWSFANEFEFKQELFKSGSKKIVRLAKQMGEYAPISTHKPTFGGIQFN